MTADPKPTDGARMRRFWDARAQENAAWYVDTSLSYDAPDMERFFTTGEVIVSEALLQAPVQPAGRGLAVEIGPGLGRICRALAEHFDRVVGVDVSAEMVAQARQLVPDPRIDFVVGDGVGLSGIADASADLVTSFTVLQHLPSREMVLHYLREGARVLRPGGVLAVQWNGLPHPWRWRAQAAAWRLRQRLGLGMTTEQRSAREFVGTRVPWAPVERTLRDVGLEVAGRKGEDTLFSWVWAVKA
jgi:SAM-dependent methyltransferase